MAVVKATLHKFLKHVDAKYDEALDLHVIIDNYATHTRPVVKRRPKRHPRFTLHFTPTSSSWLNLVERWFRELTHKSIRRGACASVPEITKRSRKHLYASIGNTIMCREHVFRDG